MGPHLRCGDIKGWIEAAVRPSRRPARLAPAPPADRRPVRHRAAHRVELAPRRRTQRRLPGSLLLPLVPRPQGQGAGDGALASRWESLPPTTGSSWRSTTPSKRYGPKVEGAGIHHNPTPGLQPRRDWHARPFTACRRGPRTELRQGLPRRENSRGSIAGPWCWLSTGYHPTGPSGRDLGEECLDDGDLARAEVEGRRPDHSTNLVGTPRADN